MSFNKIPPSKKNNLLFDIYRLWQCLPKKRKLQLGLLFVLQILSALSEVISLGAIIPFLAVLTDIETLMQNADIQKIMGFLSIVDKNHLSALLAGCFAGAVIIANLLRFITMRLQAYMTAVIATDIGAKLFRKTLYKPYSFYIRNNSSELIGNMTNDLNSTLGILQGILTFVSQGLIACAIIFGLLLHNPLVSIALGITITSAYAIILFSIKHKLRRNGEIMSNSYRALIKTFQEGFGSIGFITLTRSRDIYIDQYKATDGPYRICSANNKSIRQAPKFLLEALGVAAISITAIILTINTNDVSTVVPFLGFLGLASYRLLPAGQQIYDALSTAMGLRISLTRTLDFLAEPTPDILTKPPASSLKLENSLKFENVCFDYKKLGSEQHSIACDTCEKWTLKDLNFEIKAKTTVAFVGRTGSGKSTIADLILGLLSPQKGSLRIDKTILDENNIGSWQASISYVPQNIFLTDATIAQNIAFGVKNEDIDMQKVQKVAKLAQIDNYIQTLPSKYNEMAGERGVRLSGGQLQRIGIARALYKDPSVIIFDEATSALDSNTEKEVMSSIKKIGEDMTVILIAHRLSTVEHADKIFVLEDGKILDQGNYNHLLSSQPYFKKLTYKEAQQTHNV